VIQSYRNNFVIRNDTSVRQLASGSQTSLFLVFIRCGKNASLAQALAIDGRDYDLAVSLYEATTAQAELASAGAAIYAGGLSKFHAARNIEEKFGGLSRYDFVLFLDSDLRIDPASVQKLFCLARQNQLDLCQASLTSESFSFHRFLCCDPGESMLRRTNFVEVMGPCFSQSALRRCMPTFDRAISTWGLDLLWPALLHFKGIAVIDAIQMSHPSHPPDTTNGVFYRHLQDLGVNHRHELDDIWTHSVPWFYEPGLIRPILGWRKLSLKKPARLIKRWLRSLRWRPQFPPVISQWSKRG